MLQNLLGSALGAPAATAPVLENTSGRAAENIESGINKFDKSLINNENIPLIVEADAAAVPAASTAMSGTVTLPAKALEPLRVALGGLLDVLAKGSALPASGNALPPGLHQQIEAMLAQLQQLELGLPALDVSELGALAQSLDLDLGALQSMLESVSALQQALHSALPLAAGSGRPLEPSVLQAELQALVAPAVPTPAAGDVVHSGSTGAGRDTATPAPLLALVDKVGEVLSQVQSFLQQALDQGRVLATNSTQPAGPALAATSTATSVTATVLQAGATGVASNVVTGVPLATVPAARPATAHPGAVAPQLGQPAGLHMDTGLHMGNGITVAEQRSRSTALQVPALANQALLPEALLQARQALAAGSDAPVLGVRSIPDSQSAILS
ncbi:MAG: hypothetical protein HKO07_02695, partial [Pseudomonadales bacterium]|nr:hypothetical protein [Pseudomonadales bacterium]